MGCDCVGLDPSAAMLEKMHGRACEVQSVQGTAEQLGLPDPSFDLARDGSLKISLLMIRPYGDDTTRSEGLSILQKSLY